MAKKNRGSITKYKDKYRAYYTAPKGSVPARPSKIFDNQQEANLWLMEKLIEMDRGEHIKDSTMTFRRWTKEWLEIYVAPNVRIRTAENYHQLLKSYTDPIKDKLLSEIRPMDIQLLYSNLKERGLAASTLQRIHAVLRGVFSQALANELVRKDIMTMIKRPKSEDQTIRFLSPEEITTFLKAAEGEVSEMMIWISAYTGMRLSETRGLTWDDAVDLEKGVIRVFRALYYSKTDGWEFSEPKTKSGIRDLPIPTPLLEKLKEYRKTWKPNHWNLVVIGKQGRPIPTSSVSLAMKRVCERTGLKISFHGLRHSLTSMLVSANMGLADVSAVLGHSNSIMTMRYAHPKKTATKEAAEKVAEILN